MLPQLNTQSYGAHIKRKHPFEQYIQRDVFNIDLYNGIIIQKNY